MTRSNRAYAWAMVGVVCLGTIVNYLSRNTLAVLAPQLEGLLKFGVTEYSYVVAAFQLAYTLMQPVCGFVLDRIGLRAGFALFAALWSVAGMLHAFAGSWGGLALLRGGLGATEAAAIPAGMKSIGEWFRGAERSAAVGWFNVGTSFGAMLAPPLVVGLTLAFGWRAAFVATGVLGLVWAGLWYAVYRSPVEMNVEAVDVAPRVAVLEIIRSRKYWAIAIPRFLSEPAWQTFNFWIPLYLATERHWDLKQIALFAWTPFLAADLGGVFGGYLSPMLVRWLRLDLVASRIAVAGVGAVLMIGPGLIALAGDAYLAMALFCVGGFAHQMISVTINTLSADLFPSRTLGAANGWVGTAGWTGGLLFSLLIGQVVHVTGYGPLFACLGVFDLLGFGVLAIMLRGQTSIEETA